MNVTKGFNHLLKSPFSIHPKTGNVCIVFKPEKAANLKLDEVPTIHTLLEESAENNSQQENNMRNSIKTFQDVVFALEKSEALRRRSLASMYLSFFLTECTCS